MQFRHILSKLYQKQGPQMYILYQEIQFYHKTNTLYLYPVRRRFRITLFHGLRKVKASGILNTSSERLILPIAYSKNEIKTYKYNKQTQQHTHNKQQQHK